MRLLTTCLFLLLACSALAQKQLKLNAAQQAFVDEQDSIDKTCDSCKCTGFPPWTIIFRKTAQRRFDLFAIKAKNTSQTALLKGIYYRPVGVRALLNAIINNKAYTGFRAYFADSSAPGSTSGKLLLVFAPTYKKGGHKYYPDDTDHYMIIDGETIKVVKKTTATAWITKAKTGILSMFQTDGVSYTKRPDFNETHSLWYAKRVLVHKPGFRNGLIDILNCRIHSHNLKWVHVRYGAFLGGLHPRYQLTLVFVLTSGKPDRFISLLESDDPNGSDTGNPCPPPSKCSTVDDATSQ